MSWRKKTTPVSRTKARSIERRAPRFKRDGDTIRHFYSGEGNAEMADPGQDPHNAPDMNPLWIILDTTPEGRGADWYPKLDYDA